MLSIGHFLIENIWSGYAAFTIWDKTCYFDDSEVSFIFFLYKNDRWNTFCHHNYTILTQRIYFGYIFWEIVEVSSSCLPCVCFLCPVSLCSLSGKIFMKNMLRWLRGVCGMSVYLDLFSLINLNVW